MPTSHQMCQISAKPMMVAKKAQMKPTGLLRGMSMATYSGSSRSLAFSIARRLTPQYASSPSTLGSTAKLNSGGGDAVAHSSERPFHGSPVRSRKASRWRML